MALIKCVDCGKEISEHAPACIHCGRPKGAPEDAPPPPPPPPKKRVKPFIALQVTGGLCLAVGLLSLLAGRSSTALPLLALGLTAVLTGSVWSWLTKE